MVSTILGSSLFLKMIQNCEGKMRIKTDEDDKVECKLKFRI